MSESIPLHSMRNSGDSDNDAEPLILNDNHHRTRTSRRGGIKRPRWKFKNIFNFTRSRNSDVSERCVSAFTAKSPSYNYASNALSNAKYSPVTFIPIILFEQFRFFFNLYFLLVALSQAIPALRIGYLSSYVVPLAFVLTVTMAKEAWDDILRRRRDSEANSEQYEVVDHTRLVQSRNLRVGDLVRIHKNQRVPADMVLLRSSEASGEVFIRTDQLDGETDWKLRIACPLSQRNNVSEDDLLTKVNVIAGPPVKDIHEFQGRLNFDSKSAGLNLDNTMWANTVVASGVATGMILYTGKDTRQAMNTSQAGTKVGLLELELNSLSKILCACVFVLSVGLVAIHGFGKEWYVNIMRFLILFSTIIPVSLRVNLDLGKSFYAYQIEHDSSIPDTVVRTSTIPEDLGRIEYLLTDKTGTLTQNDMEMKKIHVGSMSYAGDSMDEVAAYIGNSSTAGAGPRSKRDVANRVRDIVTCLAVCHCVTPSFEDGELTYQAASPDEIAIVNWTREMGLELFRRDRQSLVLKHIDSGKLFEYKILNLFPFSSDNKRMGIVVYDETKQETWFYEKGADTVMRSIVQENDWLDEEVSNMAREGLRTLVIGRKRLSTAKHESFQEEFEKASAVLGERDQAMSAVVKKHLEHDVELLGITGVEDRLQKDVKPSLELLRNAGIKIWMLTGDKVETANCVAVSSKLVSRGQVIFHVTKVQTEDAARDKISFLSQKLDLCLLIDGESLSTMLSCCKNEFVKIAVQLPVVIACRCSPQQKADVTKLIKEYSKKRVCCIGDGGNDVSMIQAADVGVGIVGKEGRQASLAADFSITQFCYLTKLLVWHGRNSYKRSAKLAQFVIHRGLIISVCQTVFSVASSFEPLALYQGWLMVGYATVYTMAPVFSLVLDKDVDESLAKLYPELYKELVGGHSLSYKTFFVWVLVSIYQGTMIQGLSQILVSLKSSDFTKMVAVSFTALLFNELGMVAIEFITWCKTMVITEILTIAIYIGSVPFLGDYFDLLYLKTPAFYWKSILILATALIPPWIVKIVRRRLKPPNYAKVQQNY